MRIPLTLLAVALATPYAFATTASAIPSCPGDGSVRTYQEGGALYVCTDSNAAGLVVVVDPTGPSAVEVWRTGDTLTDHVLCLRERVIYALDESETDLWYDCWQDPHRIL